MTIDLDHLTAVAKGAYLPGGLLIFERVLNPPAVLALIERLRKAEAEVKRLREGAEAIVNDAEAWYPVHQVPKSATDLRALLAGGGE